MYDVLRDRAARVPALLVLRWGGVSVTDPGRAALAEGADGDEGH